MANKKWPPKWYQVYPLGTKEGDEEARLFRVLARNPKYEWRSTGALAKESKLAKERVEQILNKYYKKGMVFQNPSSEDQWGYWERVPNLVPDVKKSLAKKDQDDRIDKALKWSDVLVQPGVSNKNKNIWARKVASLVTFPMNIQHSLPDQKNIVKQLKKDLGLKTADELM